MIEVECGVSDCTCRTCTDKGCRTSSCLDCPTEGPVFGDCHGKEEGTDHEGLP